MVGWLCAMIPERGGFGAIVTGRIPLLHALTAHPDGTNDIVDAVAVDDNNNLYAGGRFTTAGLVAANRVAKWDGQAWSALGSGISGQYDNVMALATRGVDLYVGGRVSAAGGVPATGIARWDGSWHALGSGAQGVYGLAFDSRGNLYVAGSFTTAGGMTVNNIARWRPYGGGGGAWSPLGSGTDDLVWALTTVGTDVYVGGYFLHAGDKMSWYIGAWKPQLEYGYLPVALR